MWYDTRPQDTEDGKRVTDLCYNDGSVRRTCSDGGIVILGTELRGQDLVDEYVRNN